MRSNLTGCERLAVEECSTGHILLVGGYAPMVKALKRGLEEESFTVDVTSNDPKEKREFPAQEYDAIILDLMRPAEFDLPQVQRWREAGVKTNVLVLTGPANSNERTRVDTAENIDWLVKPFKLDEFLSRLRALIHRAETN